MSDIGIDRAVKQQEGKKKGRKERKKEGKKKGRKERKKEGKKKGRKERKKEGKNLLVLYVQSTTMVVSIGAM